MICIIVMSFLFSMSGEWQVFPSTMKSCPGTTTLLEVGKGKLVVQRKQFEAVVSFPTDVAVGRHRIKVYLSQPMGCYAMFDGSQTSCKAEAKT